MTQPILFEGLQHTEVHCKVTLKGLYIKKKDLLSIKKLKTFKPLSKFGRVLFCKCNFIEYVKSGFDIAMSL